MARKNLITDLMAERVSYGGFAATRKQVYDDIIDRFPVGPRYGIGSANWWAFSKEKLDDETADQMIQWETRKG